MGNYLFSVLESADIRVLLCYQFCGDLDIKSRIDFELPYVKVITESLMSTLLLSKLMHVLVLHRITAKECLLTRAKVVPALASAPLAHPVSKWDAKGNVNQKWNCSGEFFKD